MNVIAAGHSNVRMPKPEGPGVVRASMVLVWHAGQSGRRMIMMLDLDEAGALPNSQSPMVAYGGAVMEPSCASELGARGQYCSFIKI